MIEWLAETIFIFIVTDRLCRSLGIDSFVCLESLCDENRADPTPGEARHRSGIDPRRDVLAT